MEIFIKDIKIGQRFREKINPFFINNLALDIEDKGLLHPIGVTKDNNLIFGRCRIEAYKLLKREKIEANIFDFSGSNLRRAEASENLLQSGRSPSELLAIRRFFLDEEKAKARARMKAGKKISPNKEPSGNFPQGKSRDIVAAYTGKSPKTLDAMQEVEDASKAHPNDGKYTHLWEELESNNYKPFKALRILRSIKSMEKAIAEAKSEYDTEDIEKLGSGLVSSVQLYYGEFREVAKDKVKDDSVPLIFTDPMYGEKDLPIYAHLAELAKRVLKDGGSLVTYGNSAYIPEIIEMIRNKGLKYKRIIAIELEGSFAPVWPDVTAAWKPLLWFYKGDKPTVHGRIRDFIKSKRAEDKDWSPLKQSVIEAGHVIEKLTVESELVHDPMMGQGTTGLAALQIKRRFIGIDKDSQQFKIAKSNIKKVISVISDREHAVI